MEGVPAARGYSNSFLTDLMVKGIRLASEEAGPTLLVRDPELALYEALQAGGYDHEGFGSIYRHVYGSEGDE